MTLRLRLPVVGHCLVTGDPTLVAEIAKNRDLIGGRGTEALRPVVGQHSLIAIEGERHQAHRKALLPHFFYGDLQRYDTLTRKWACQALQEISQGQTFEGSRLASTITLNAMVEILFGALNAEQHQAMVSHIQTWLASFRNPAILFLKPLHVNLGAWSGWGRFLINREKVHTFIREQMTRKAAHGVDGGVLGALLRARTAGDHALTDDEIISETVTFLLFGHDTSAEAMGWVFHHLWNHADALAAVQNEVGTLTNAHAEVLPENLPLLQSAIQESLRLCPVVVHLTRHATANTAVGEHVVPAGTRVLPCQYLAHRNPAVFEQATQYQPTRFLNPKPEWRHAYFPFGLGQRLCAGMPMAQRQMALIAATLLTHSQMETVGPEKVRPVRKMVLIVPSGGPRLRRVR